MKEVVLKPKRKSAIPVEAEIITPDNLAGKRLPEIETLPVHVGNEVQELGEHFDLEGEIAETATEQLISIKGSVPWVKYIGSDMTAGSVIIEGDAGMHTGAGMSGGELFVKGSASDWAGAEMKGGLIRICGDAGDLLGAAYRGSKDGMTGGCILVEGNVGTEAGAFMRRGMIVTLGGVGPFAGVHMNGGEIFVFGHASKRLGAEMKGNSSLIACFGPVSPLLPTFIHDTTYKPSFMKIYLKAIRDRLGVKEADKLMDVSFRRYRGDIAVGGDGDILIAEI